MPRRVLTTTPHWARRAALAISLGAAALAAAALLSAGPAGPPPALAAPDPASTGVGDRRSPSPSGAGAPAVLLLATRPGASHTTLHLATLGAADPGPAVATLGHLPDAVVRASALPGTDVVVATADAAPGRDLSFNATLSRLRPHAPPEPLCDRVVHASRPLVTAAGRVFVARGVAGPEPSSPEPGGAAPLRIDALSIDEVDPATGATRVVHTLSGQLLFLAGAWKDEIVLYRVSPGGADVIAVDADSGAERPIAAVLPYARDFSIDEGSGALVFQERDESDPRAWVVDRMDLATGRRERLASSPSHALAPHAWPGGGVAFTQGRRAGLALLGAAAGVRAPLGPGVDAIQAISPDRAWVAALHTSPSALPIPFAIRAATGEVAAIPAPAGARLAVAGFAPGQGGAP
jgi:hypothetical protein